MNYSRAKNHVDSARETALAVLDDQEFFEPAQMIVKDLDAAIDALGGETTVPNLAQMSEDLQYLADAIRDNAPDLETESDIAEEYSILAAVYTTMQAADDYLAVMQEK